MADPLDRYASVYSPGEEPEVKCSVRTIKEFSPSFLEEATPLERRHRNSFSDNAKAFAKQIVKYTVCVILHILSFSEIAEWYPYSLQ
jgi:hypothetical protein